MKKNPGFYGRGVLEKIEQAMILHLKILFLVVGNKYSFFIYRLSSQNSIESILKT